MFIGIRIGPRLAMGFAIVLLGLLALWGLGTWQFTHTITALSADPGAAAHGAASDLQRALTFMHCIAVAAIVLATLSLRALASSITLPLAKAVRALEAVAAGDLTHSAAIHSRDEIGRLFAAIHAMREGLGRLAQQVQADAQAVAHGNAQIAQGHGALAQRTEEQATTLQQTAASMEELSATVAANADNAIRSSELADAASSIAHEGGEAVRRVLEAMVAISENSRQVADMVGVIDGIAFQTNILALNAAVEAARAGEQGRGFAVVANEVRQLAHRSADAAHHIKALIDEAALKRQSARGVASQARDTMEKVEESVRAVTALMNDVARASQEQRAGIHQVSTGVAEMERVVQQNAAMVEEGVAATDALEQRARALLGLVARFRVGGAAEQVPQLPARLELGALELAR